MGKKRNVYTYSKKTKCRRKERKKENWIDEEYIPWMKNINERKKERKKKRQ